MTLTHLLKVFIKCTPFETQYNNDDVYKKLTRKEAQEFRDLAKERCTPINRQAEEKEQEPLPKTIQNQNAALDAQLSMRASGWAGSQTSRLPAAKRPSALRPKSVRGAKHTTR